MTAAGRRALLLLATVLAVGLAARLGFWQLDRAAQKKAWQQAIDQRGELPPLRNAELSADRGAVQSQLHRRVQLEGRWLRQHTVFLDNRQMNGRVGFYVVTPLQLSGRSEAVLVQRGWVPRDQLDRSHVPTVLTPDGDVVLSGRLTASPSRAFELGPAGTEAIRQNLDLDTFPSEIHQPLLPLTVLQTAAGADDGLPRDWPVPDAGLQKHYGYAFQWFALAALFLGLYVWFQLIRPRRQAQS